MGARVGESAVAVGDDAAEGGGNVGETGVSVLAVAATFATNVAEGSAVSVNAGIVAVAVIETFVSVAVAKFARVGNVVGARVKVGKGVGTRVAVG